MSKIFRARRASSDELACCLFRFDSKGVEKILKYTQNGWKSCTNTLETSVKNVQVLRMDLEMIQPNNDSDISSFNTTPISPEPCPLVISYRSSLEKIIQQLSTFPKAQWRREFKRENYENVS